MKEKNYWELGQSKFERFCELFLNLTVSLKVNRTINMNIAWKDFMTLGSVVSYTAEVTFY